MSEEETKVWCHNQGSFMEKCIFSSNSQIHSKAVKINTVVISRVQRHRIHGKSGNKAFEETRQS